MTDSTAVLPGRRAAVVGAAGSADVIFGFRGGEREEGKEKGY